MYGSTEIAYVTIATPEDLRDDPGAVGKVVRGTVVKILDDEGHEVPEGESGRIFVGNSAQMEGYTGGENKEIIEGLMSSGDVGHFDAKDRLHIDGRDDEMIVSGGENVFPAEVEELLAGHEAVQEAAVIGVDDEKFGQRLKAFVVLRDGKEASEDELKGYVKDNLANYKTPREVVFLDELPRNPTGKVLKRELKEHGEDASAEGASGEDDAERGRRRRRWRRRRQGGNGNERQEEIKGRRQGGAGVAATPTYGPPYAGYQAEIFLRGLADERPAHPVALSELAAAVEARRRAPYRGVRVRRRRRRGHDAGQRGGVPSLADRPPDAAGRVDARPGVTVLGTELPAPLGLAPIGIQTIVHPDGELAVARAAAAVGLPMTVSTVSGSPLEEIAEAAEGPKWFQLYWPVDRELAASFLSRAERAGYRAIVVTLDTFLPGWKPRDLTGAWQPFLEGVGIANYLSDPGLSRASWTSRPRRTRRRRSASS